MNSTMVVFELQTDAAEPFALIFSGTQAAFQQPHLEPAKHAARSWMDPVMLAGTFQLRNSMFQSFYNH